MLSIPSSTRITALLRNHKLTSAAGTIITSGNYDRHSGMNSTRELNIVARPSDLIGNTPMIDLTSLLTKRGVDGT